MDSFLVVGLESSCTRYVSVLLAANLGIPEAMEWNGHDKIENEMFSVVHRSLPHGGRNNFISEGYWILFGTVVLCTRDMSCSLGSKMKWHQRDMGLALAEHDKGRRIMGEILVGHKKAEVYSYESAFLMGRAYNEMFFSKIGVPYTVHIPTKDVNSKYFLKRS